MATAHPALEEYLKTIRYLMEEGVPVIQIRVAGRLGKTPAAVSEVITRLETEGYLVRAGRQLALTERGQHVADRVVRRHRLAEGLLVSVIGIPWSAAHVEAGRWEHVISDLVEERLVTLLGDPGTCPHGNPIPGSHNPAPERAALTALDQVEPGQRVRLERLTEDVEDDRAALEYLESVGFVNGTVATLRERQPEGMMVLEQGGTAFTLGPDLTCRLLVAQLPPGAPTTEGT